MNIAELRRDYPNLELHFESYYKYQFTFVGKLPDGSRVVVTTGGDGGDIYRDSYSAVETVNTIDAEYVEIVHAD